MEKLPSGLSGNVADDEDLARFLPHNSYFSREKMMVKQVAFLPHRDDHETSVFRHGSDPRADLWALGTAAVPTFLGAAIVKARIVRAEGLTVEADEPPLRHAVIRNWSCEGDPDMQKAQQKALALTIASKSELILR